MTDLQIQPLPPNWANEIEAWVELGIPPRGLLLAFLQNDLKTVLALAAPEDVNRFKNLLRFLLHYCPSICWGDQMSIVRWTTVDDLIRAQTRRDLSRNLAWNSRPVLKDSQ